MEMKSIGERIRLRRKELELTQKQLGKRVGVSHVAISQWEKEETEPKGDNLLSLADALMCTAEYILRGTTSEKPIRCDNDTYKYSRLTKREENLLEMFNALTEDEQKNYLKEITETRANLERIYKEMKEKEKKSKRAS
ncbi:helix-turn-helix domain-containing protein [Arsenophonus nasoniae]|uniref:HTH-type transcriptional regulator Xre n=2 Tax=Arsenophonus nasoniae TaxID=638 RepID=D2U4L3_9GAMM|nr:helix-turn-helix domain-containing protein [Arsenophonus nasoniae]QBY44154.1 HTH-type transcriptional regulator Xre [Arsenophonus nasoniae]WGM04454.1 helix-turn-helix domain-containing protein [Arsenophonus nasoniae]WGM09560.1 helix-turn-helix domain-containing protein [Arsenophonus nasoniae]WGM14281.1 helix-turn-helix domain-containing protein [Arsenophonus nasoniae]CBA76570.1 phage transcriptional regulator [Arsenophonus nasoniae]